MNIITLEQAFTLLTILSAVGFGGLSTVTNSWASERSDSEDNDLENQVRSETDENNELSRTLNDDTDPSENNTDSRTDIEITNDILAMEKAKLSIMLKSVRIEGQKNFVIEIDAKNPTPSQFVFNTGDRDLGLKPHDVELDPGTYEVKIYPQGFDPEFGKEQYNIHTPPFECSGPISLGEHKTCEITIEEWPRLMIYTHAAADGIKASDFLIGLMENNKVVDEFPGSEEGKKVPMGWAYEYRVYVKEKNGYYVQYSKTPDLQDADPYWCAGKIEDDGNPSFTKANCYITIDLSQLKVIVIVEGGPSPVGMFKYKINTDDVTVNGKEYSGDAQGTEIPIKPGATYDVQPLQYDNYDSTKSGECDNGQAESGKVKLCTLTMTYHVEQCHTEINEQGKPEKIC